MYRLAHTTAKAGEQRARLRLIDHTLSPKTPAQRATRSVSTGDSRWEGGVASLRWRVGWVRLCGSGGTLSLLDSFLDQLLQGGLNQGGLRLGARTGNHDDIDRCGELMLQQAECLADRPLPGVTHDGVAALLPHAGPQSSRPFSAERHEDQQDRVPGGMLLRECRFVLVRSMHPLARAKEIASVSHTAWYPVESEGLTGKSSQESTRAKCRGSVSPPRDDTSSRRPW